MPTLTLDYKDYAAWARRAGAEGIVLLKNEQQLLPLAAGSRLAVFGRTQYDTVYCGTGSGGMVNVPYVISIYEGLAEVFALSEALNEAYCSWLAEHPFDEGEGWAATPWSQEEMPLSDELLAEARAFSDTALFVLGRTAGEDRDNAPQPGAYYLTETELANLRRLRAAFPRLIVLVNAGNIIDLAWEEKLGADALLYLWQGGCETGRAAAAVLSGQVNPSGRLPDTVARRLEDYPAHDNFGDGEMNIYQEDIYVGYRYFATFDPEAVLYPFGFGLSYTTFELKKEAFSYQGEGRWEASFRLRNSGPRPGRTVVQLYVRAPQGELGKPARVLADFKKSALLQPGAEERLTFSLEAYDYASYDDRPGRHAWVLEAGRYEVYAGFDVRAENLAGTFVLPETLLVEQLKQALAPSRAFEVLYPQPTEKGLQKAYRPAVRKSAAYAEKRTEEAMPYDPALKHSFNELRQGQITPAEFLRGISDEELIKFSCGLGMGPSGVTPGVAGAVGGTSPALRALDIPLAACADGPSGLRLDDGAMAFSLPNGSCLAATFDTALNEELFAFMALECRKNKIASLLGPGMNIHRYPLNGRNFEYFSEDPLLTGRMARAQAKGLNRYGVAATVKHFALNNQEYRRSEADAVASERAIREIYLKGFEIGVRSGEIKSIMTGYNPLNGRQCASHYELNTAVLRDEWGYDGIVMTDWWAAMNRRDYGPKSRQDLAAMIRAQNDLYMVVLDTAESEAVKAAEKDLAEGYISRAELLRNAQNICRFIERYSEKYKPEEIVRLNEPSRAGRRQTVLDLGEIGPETEVDLSGCNTDRGASVLLRMKPEIPGRYELALRLSSDGPETAQMNITVKNNLVPVGTLSLHGKTASTIQKTDLDLSLNPNVFVELFFAESGVTLYEAGLRLKVRGQHKIY